MNFISEATQSIDKLVSYVENRVNMLGLDYFFKDGAVADCFDQNDIVEDESLDIFVETITNRYKIVNYIDYTCISLKSFNDFISADSFLSKLNKSDLMAKRAKARIFSKAVRQNGTVRKLLNLVPVHIAPMSEAEV